MVVWAWRLLVAPIVPDPKRDPSLRLALFELRGCACSVCGEETVGWEAEHSRPLGRGGADSLRNMTPMCQADHRRKSAAERRVWAVSKRWEKRLAIFQRRPSPAVSVALVLFAAGFVTTRWVAFSLIALALLWWGPPIWRKIRPSWTGRSMGGGGFNRIPDYQKLLEMTRAGIEGWILRGYWDVRRRAFIARYLPMFALCIHLSGVYTRHFGIDTAVIAARILF